MQRWSGRRDSNPVYVSGWCLRQSPCPLPRLGPPRRRPVARSFLLTAPHGGKPFKSAMRGGDRRESNPCFLGGGLRTTAPAASPTREPSRVAGLSRLSRCRF